MKPFTLVIFENGAVVRVDKLSTGATVLFGKISDSNAGKAGIMEMAMAAPITMKTPTETPTTPAEARTRVESSSQKQGRSANLNRN